MNASLHAGFMRLNSARNPCQAEKYLRFKITGEPPMLIARPVPHPPMQLPPYSR
jgi:hypothetical protein